MKCGIIGYPLNNPRSILIWKDYFLKKIQIQPIHLNKYLNKTENSFNNNALNAIKTWIQGVSNRLELI